MPHERLGIKIQHYGIAGDTLNWILAFLSHRKQSVVVDGSQSSWRGVSSGLPQGSVICPTLFLLFINDIQDNIKSPLWLFADDCVVYREIVPMKTITFSSKTYYRCHPGLICGK